MRQELELWDRAGSTITHGRGIIAKCPAVQDGGVFDWLDNARLIAAAPELLNTLKALLTAMEPRFMRTGASESEEKAIKAAQVAIQKATV